MSHTHGLSALLSAALLAGAGLMRLDVASAVYPLAPPLYSQIEKVTAGDTLADDHFGASVAVDGDTFVVGTPDNDNWGNSAGVAHVFKRNIFEYTGLDFVWGSVIRLFAFDAAAGDSFGASVAISGDILAVAAPYKGSSTGAVYVFERNTGGAEMWGQVAKLTASDAAQADCFGASVAMDGDTLVVGAYGKASDAGAAYVFARNQGGADAWGQVAKLVASDADTGDYFGRSVAISGDTGDYFGRSVAISGDTLVVGAYGKASNAGAAYVFARNHGGADKWGQVARLTPSDAAQADHFGASVAIDGDTLVAAARVKESTAGTAYVFARNHGGADAWGQVARLTASDTAAGDSFGVSVAISGGTLVAGAPTKGSNAGTVYVFARNQGGADAWGQVAKLTASDATSGDYFGRSVAMDGDLLVAGAPGEDERESEAGAVYTFAAGGLWQEVAIPRASDGAAGDYYSQSVAMDGDTLVAGASGKANRTGAAYIFARNHDGADAWSQVVRLAPSGAAAGDSFGDSVAIDGDTVVVGAYGKASRTGAAYVFARNHDGPDVWGEVIELAASDAAAGDTFGASVAISGGTLAVGASGKGSNAGAVYVFARNHDGADAWGQVTKLVASDPAPNDSFGVSVALDGDTLVVGAYAKASNAGAAYVFARNQGGADAWGQVAKLTASDATSGDYFGRSVAISGDTVVVGAPTGGSNVAGTAYVFKRNYDGPDAWGEVGELVASDAAQGAEFGRSVAIGGDTLVVGAYFADAHAGAAYVFVRDWHGDYDHWSEVKKLVTSDAAADAHFGNSAAIGGGALVVGACQRESQTGAAYVFELAATETHLPLIFKR